MPMISSMELVASSEESLAKRCKYFAIMMTALGIVLAYNTLNGNLFKALGEGAQWLSEKPPIPEDEK